MGAIPERNGAVLVRDLGRPHCVIDPKHNYTLEPNVSFTADNKMVIFRSNMFGPTHVFALDADKAK